MEATRSSETSVHNKPTGSHIPEDGILHSHRRETSDPLKDRLHSKGLCERDDLIRPMFDLTLAPLGACLVMVLCLFYFSTLKMEALCSFVASVGCLSPGYIAVYP
jgi:hypothetical protein